MKVRAQIGKVLNLDRASAALWGPLPPRPSLPEGKEGGKSAMHLSIGRM
jgi:hypothetical protein